jgi:peptidyl-prolyl cis-trans isomerase B (cyclophilin B)
MNQLRAEPNGERMTAWAVAAVTFPGRPDSAGTQFVICIGDQPQFDGQFTVFARVAEGHEVVRQISAIDAESTGRALTRVEIRAVTLRDKPAEPFLSATAAELRTFHAIIETSMGTMTVEFFTDKAPETSRVFLRRAQAGLYDGVSIHRVSPNFVVQTGALNFRATPLTVTQQKLVFNLPPEFNDTPHVPGVVSMARGDDPASASTSFFVCSGDCRSLDGKYTAFGRVVAGLDVLARIAAVPVQDETPLTPMVVTRIRVEPAVAVQ